MALVVVGSAKAAPGVTTLTVALAALFPGRAVAADLDPEGGDLALRYRAPDGGPLNPELGLLSLAASLRGDQPRSFRAEPRPVGDPLPAHLQTTAGGLDVLLGVNGPDQAVGLGPLWAPLARALSESPATVIADCGRIGAASPALPVVRQADAVILLARAELEELAHLRERLRYLLGTAERSHARFGVVLVTGERDRSAGPKTEQLLRSSGVPVPVLGTVTDDPKGAARLRGVGGGRADRTTLIRSIRALVPQVAALAGVAPGSTVPAVPDAGPQAVAGPPAPEPEKPEFPGGFAAPGFPAADQEGNPLPHRPTTGRRAATGETWRETETPPGGTGWPSEPSNGGDPYGVSSLAGERRP